ncbi:aspartyl/asparaginyl beta-hydroxylase domain-containing protein [Streptomyces alkaliterrae]|uniref:Aspartyl/asparaginyl beta-hydroxylase domain-containing protein n=1 Tax=Streptomyces alkaliterrae TaxID=2213162 RepID=A0A5P0YSI6_9ACTN|nr:aspartyl/asparaginyl beta-hydroxylase domain-containing protein [Streptomyces alkaliterrae]MBB1260929.1 aspartyl/asparaginyl beta-hydroxylase domain-containing protein [Streptomyces alkaliterrae]MQS03238.1 aspartyl/asparaginyl beta-hydroxylase domain-containing protein [Streptomyces alkaliterrae]
MTTTSLTAAAEAAQLSPVFDAGRLAAELAAVTTHTWNVQRTHTYGGQVGQAASIDWRVLPLRSLGGDSERTDPGGPGPQPFAATRWLDQLPYLAQILHSLPAPLNAVRLMALGPGAVSNPHSDPKYRLDRGIVRLHIPVVTDPGAVLVLDGVEHCWQPGTFWYGDFSREHLVRNTSQTVTRIHVVIDALLTADLAAWFPDSWQQLLTRGEVLFNRTGPHPAPAWPAGLPYEALLPSGFADFDAAAPLDGALIPARIDRGAGGVLALTIAGRTFALVPVGGPEFRFSGWSEQRTLQPDSDGGGLALRVRRGRALADRHMTAAPRTS